MREVAVVVLSVIRSLLPKVRITEYVVIAQLVIYIRTLLGSVTLTVRSTQMITIVRNKDNLFSLKSWYYNQETLKLNWVYSINNKTLDEIAEFVEGRGNATVNEDIKTIFTTPMSKGNLLNKAFITQDGIVSAIIPKEWYQVDVQL